MSDVIKNAAKHLQESLSQDYGKKVRSSHAHAAVSGYLGYNSKKALLADNCDEPIEDEFVLFHSESAPNPEVLENVISRMKNTPLKELSTRIVERSIEAALTPPCEVCGHKTGNSYPVFQSDYPDEPIAQVCSMCVKDEEEYGECRFCGILCRAEEINEAGECPEHYGEGSYSEEELEDIESFVEYHMNH